MKARPIFLFVSLVLFLMLVPSPISAAQAVSIAANIEELNGFALWQNKTAIRSTLGEPSETVETDSSTSEVHFLSESGYIIFEYCNTFPDNVCSIQITGNVPDMETFLGLKLGVPEKRVHEVLGPPSNVENLTEPKIQALRYKQLNGSVEIDEHGRLFTIGIKVMNDMLVSPKTIGDPWTEFVSALRVNDTAAILNALRSDVEIYRDGDIFNIERSIRIFASLPTKSLCKRC